MEKIEKFKAEKYTYIVCIIHFVISCVCSYDTLSPLRENVGSENTAYIWFETGMTLQNDTLSRILCWVYAHILAAIIIFIFWKWFFYMIYLWKENIIKKRYMVTLLILIASGILTILALYPVTLTSPPDTRYNYVYVKEWLPMYWHGFLTNVVHCACLFVFPHPAAMSIIPFMFGINTIFYFTYNMTIQYSKKYAFVKALIWGGILLLMPETVRLLTYAGRNYMYAILSLGILGLFLKDYLEKKELSKEKFFVLTFLMAAISTWRSEGILYLIAYPFLLYFTYFIKDREDVDKKKILMGAAYIGMFYMIFALPGNYGNKKYQGYDYFIINTPGPLSAVFADENANLSYDGVNEDLSNIEKVVPLDYIRKYGEYATAYYNWDNFRLSRQCNAGDSGKAYVAASYSILLHNWPIYFKYQINLFARSIGLPVVFEMPVLSTEKWSSTMSSEAREWHDWIMDYYAVGERDITENHDVILINKLIDRKLNEIASFITSKLYRLGWKISGFVKMSVTLLTLIVVFISLIKKQWIYACWGALFIAILMGIVLTAPAARNNYYYSIYFNQYWFLYFAWYQRKKNKGDQ